MSSIGRNSGGQRAPRSGGLVRALMAIAAIGTMTGVAVVGFVATAGPAAAVGCTGDTWTNSSGGSWDTNGNWSNDAPPGTGAAACITAAGSYTVTIGNETISAGALTVGGSGSTPTLTIGNSASGSANVTFASASNSGTIEPGLGATLTVPGAFLNTGTLEVPSSTFGGATLNLSALDNQGAFDVNQTSTLSLPTSSATLTNDSTGTLSVASGQTLSVTSPSGQTGSVTQDGVIDNSGTIAVQDAVTVNGGSICGNAPHVGLDGQSATIASSLTFGSTVAAGPSCGTGIETDNLFIANITGTLSGNIPAIYTVSIGDGGSSAAKISVPSAMTVLGTLNLGFEGSLSSTSAITNQGTVDAVASGFNGQAFSFTSFTNEGSLDINTPSTYSLPLTTSTLMNTSTGTINVSTGNSLAVSSPSTQTGKVTQDGVIDNSGSFVVQDAVAVNGGSICGTALHVGADAQSTSIASSLAFASTVPAGPSCGTGVETDNLFIANIAGTLSGSIPKAYTVTIGDGGAGFANVTIPSAMTISGTLDVGFEGSLSSSAAITNKGTVDAVSSGFNGQSFSFTSFTNEGALDLNTPTTYSLPTKTSTLVNDATGTIAVSSSLAISSPTGVKAGAKVTQDGLIDNTGSITVQNALSIDGGSICDNSVHVGVDGQSTSISSPLTFATTVPAGPSCGTSVPTDNLFMANITGTLTGNIPKGYTVAIGDGGSSFANITAATTKKNLGTLEPGFGATVSLPKLKNKGTLEVPASGFTTHLNLAGNLSNKKMVVLDGATQITFASGASLVNLAATSSVTTAGVSVQIVSGNFTNNGVLGIAAGGTFAVAGTYTQASTGTYEPGLASASSFGVLNVTSTAALAGKLSAQVASGFTPTSGSTFGILNSGGLGGTQFTTVTGPFTQVISGGDISLKAN